MDFTEFTQEALRTESKIETAEIDLKAFTILLKMFIEVGTLLDYTKKGIFYSNYEKYDTNDVKLMSNLNDLLAELMDNSNIATRTATTAKQVNFRVMHGLLGIVTESSEVAEILLKQLETGDVDNINVQEESIGDIGWYQAVLCDELKIDQSIGLKNVIDKLRVRFPDKFSSELAANRDIASERAELEKNTYVADNIPKIEVDKDGRKTFYIDLPDDYTREEIHSLMDVVMKEVKSKQLI